MELVMDSKVDEAGSAAPRRGRYVRDDSFEIDLGMLGDALGFNLRMAQSAAFRAFVRRTGDATLKPGYYALLSIVDTNPGLTQAELGRAIGRDKSSITPVLCELEQRGLIEKRRDARDRRVNTLWLTKDGTRLLSVLREKAREHDRALEQAIGRENRELFLALLLRIRRHMSDNNR